jgi:hypothetical protein
LIFSPVKKLALVRSRGTGGLTSTSVRLRPPCLVTLFASQELGAVAMSGFSAEQKKVVVETRRRWREAERQQIVEATKPASMIVHDIDIFNHMKAPVPK